MGKYDEIRQSACSANLDLQKQGLVILTFGNASAADRKQGLFAIKPSGISYEELTPDKMVIVDFDARVVEGKLRPSSDTKTHAVLYKTWEKIGGIAHTHSTYATAWCQAQRDIPIFGTTHADSLTSDVPCAPPMNDEMIKVDYETETGFQIVSCFRDRKLNYEEVEMILLANHAPFTWGTTAARAVYNCVVLETIARLACLTGQINPDAPRLKEGLVRKHFERKHGPDSYYGQK